MKNFRWCCFFFLLFCCCHPFQRQKNKQSERREKFGCLCNQTTSIVFFSFFPFFLFFSYSWLLLMLSFLVAIFCNTNFNSNSNINPSLNITRQMYIYLLYPKIKERRVKIYVKRIKMIHIVREIKTIRTIKIYLDNCREYEREEC